MGITVTVDWYVETVFKRRRWASMAQRWRGYLCHLDGLLWPWSMTSRI